MFKPAVPVTGSIWQVGQWDLEVLQRRKPVRGSAVTAPVSGAMVIVVDIARVH